jgi:aspartate/glutamate racemase
MISGLTAVPPPTAAVAGLPVHRYGGFREAVDAIARYAVSLQTQAAERRSRGLSVSDQDFPEEAFSLEPPGVVARRPLVLIGGMGPLAGVLAFRKACERFGDSRVTILYQACSVPDRTPAILADRETRSAPPGPDVAAQLARAVKKALDLSPCAAEQRVDCVIACNSAHYFWQPLKIRLAESPDVPRRLNLISIVKSSHRALRAAACGRVLLLCTEGARAGRIFSGAATETGICFGEPTPDLDRLLMRAIYDGVKSLDEGRAVEFGTLFFEGVLRRMGHFHCILAGCTEVPPLLELLKDRSTPTVKAFLSRVAVIDPMDAALDASAEDPCTATAH